MSLFPITDIEKVNKLKIFNFGLPRTGTTSFHQFMQKIGLKSIHTNDGYINRVFPHDYNQFILADNTDDLSQNQIQQSILNNQVFSDLPWYSIFLQKKLMEKYSDDPNIVFVCTIRQKEKWIQSIKKIIPCIITKAERDFHQMEYHGILTSHLTETELNNRLSDYYDSFYEHIKKYKQILLLPLENTEEIKSILFSLLNNPMILNIKYPHLNQ